MSLPRSSVTWSLLAIAGAGVSLAIAQAQQQPPLPPPRGATSYLAVDIKEPFATTMARMKAAQPAIQQRQAALLAERYELGDQPAQGVTMTRGKPVQGGVRVKPPPGTGWEQLAQLSPADIRDRGLFPAG